MTKRSIIAGSAALALLALAACGKQDAAGGVTAPATPVAAVPAPAGQDWTETVSATADGFVMGNPDAPVKLVEIGSLTCSHCGEFSKVGAPPLKADYVATGKVSWEFRNYVRDPIDLAAAILVRCGGPAPFFAMTEQFYAQQAAMFDRAQAVPQAAMEALQREPAERQAAGVARLYGLDEFVQARGVPAARAQACLADPAMTKALIDGRDRMNAIPGFSGTPTFLIGGKLVPDTASWAALEPALKAATGG